MMRTSSLAMRRRLLGVLVSAGPLAIACGGAIEREGTSQTSAPSPSADSPRREPSPPNATPDEDAPSPPSANPTTPESPPPKTSQNPKLTSATCTNGGDPCGPVSTTPATVVCLTHDEMWKLWGAESPGATPPWDANGCLPGDALRNQLTCYGSPNANVVAGPIPEGGACCYAFCYGCCSGRPLVVRGEARVARGCSRDDWMQDARIRAREVLVDTTARAANAWLDDACMEHASIGSFARFSLQLLALGAPPELLVLAQRAMADEIEHARLCFTIASRLLGRPVGPGPLPITGLTIATSLADVAAETVREGCVGETLAALYASEQSDVARDEEIRAALARIAEDEARHAELAWRFVRWAIEIGGRDVRDAVATAFEEALRQLPLPPGDEDVEAWNALGRLDEERAARVANSAREDVLRPCIDALISTHPIGLVSDTLAESCARLRSSLSVSS
jgi:hypothetical protein